ncbi:unnamed protein product [Trichogramma brassicae]|uniref:Probable ATP-dependent RNA helicase DDX52 n=1 Tax=Trichogramma brassicae TaxID=86971 RepID=A0A6H5IFD7_9HYME|nr:unnamed protein product [Trichogramma brassicae]
MDAYEISQKLEFGVRYDLKSFHEDAVLFGLLRKPTSTGVKIKTENVQKVDESVEIKTEPDSEPESESEVIEDDSQKKSLKRKCSEIEDASEANESEFTILDGIKAGADGKILKEKKKQKLMTDELKLKLEQEKINHFRNIHHISVTGAKVPVPIKSFDELRNDYNIGDDIIANMKKCGYEEPTAIQMQALPVMLQNRRILACAPTGSGKTASFLIPIIHQLKGPKSKGFRAIIISPTRELAKQTYRECIRLSEGRDFRIHIISKVNQAAEKYGPKSSQKFDILITTPKRLVYLLSQEPPTIALNNAEWLVVDEADKLFEEGKRGFKEQLDIISKACTNPDLRQGMFSATNTPAVTKWCRHNFKGLVTVTIGSRNSAADTVDQQLLFVGNEQGKLIAFRDLVKEGLTPPVLVFVQSKERAQKLFTELIYDGLNVDLIHSDRTQTQRDNVVQCFREGKIWVLICTELMGRGIDFKGVKLVINYDFPPSAISYIHRIGRTGRAGEKGKAITYFTTQDTENLRSIAAVMRNSGCEIPEYMLALKKKSKRKFKQTNKDNNSDKKNDKKSEKKNEKKIVKKKVKKCK